MLESKDHMKQAIPGSKGMKDRVAFDGNYNARNVSNTHAGEPEASECSDRWERAFLADCMMGIESAA